LGGEDGSAGELGRERKNERAQGKLFGDDNKKDNCDGNVIANAKAKSRGSHGGCL
jgi:hypothetical protein